MLRSILAKSRYLVLAAVLGSLAAALALLEELPCRTDIVCEVLRAPPVPEGFNYSRLVNLGSARADTPLLLHCNNDIEALAKRLDRIESTLAKLSEHLKERDSGR